MVPAKEASSAIVDFEAIYQSEFAYVWKYLRRVGVAERHLEDVMHDVFVVAFRKLDQYDPARPIRPWLTGIAFRVASDHRRKAQNHRELIGQDVEPSENGERTLDQRRKQRLVLAALDRLDDNRRSVFVLYELEGYSMPEISRILDVGVNTLYSRLRLARQQFETAVKQLLQESR